VNIDDTFLSQSSSVQVFKRLILQHFGLEDPCLQLKHIPQWLGFLRNINLSETILSNASTYLFGGYFYNFCSKVPTLENVEREILNARECKASLIMIPTVPNLPQAEFLKELGFIKIPSYIESRVIFNYDSLEHLLLKNLGRKRFLQLMREHEFCNQKYVFSFFHPEKNESDGTIIEDAVNIHRYNCIKYNHPLNFYNKKSLYIMLSSSLNINLRIGIHYEKDSMEPRQAGFFFLDDIRSQMYFMAQGISTKNTPPLENLYISLFFKVFRLAENLGYQEVHLGRGGHRNKKRMGANQFILLNNWIYPLNSSLKENTRNLAKESTKFFIEEISLLKPSMAIF
jgi:hypothetical protein